jgi:hypothetical protein
VTFRRMGQKFIRNSLPHCSIIPDTEALQPSCGSKRAESFPYQAVRRKERKMVWSSLSPPMRAPPRPWLPPRLVIRTAITTELLSPEEVV